MIYLIGFALFFLLVTTTLCRTSADSDKAAHEIAVREGMVTEHES